MALFQQMVLDYLEHYQPGTYEALKNQHRLRDYVVELAEQLYAERDRIHSRLEEEQSDMSDEQLAWEAESLAIAAVLPMPDEQPNEREATQ